MLNRQILGILVRLRWAPDHQIRLEHGGHLRSWLQVDRMARAEGRPQDATSKVPLEGWAFPLNASSSDPGLQEVESALRARGSQLEKRFEEEMTALKALLSDPEFQASQI